MARPTRVAPMAAGQSSTRFERNLHCAVQLHRASIRQKSPRRLAAGLRSGYFFGTTQEGGDPSCGCGVVFKLAPNSSGGWAYTVLYRFTGAPDGEFPSGELTRDSKGYLYGTTQFGGDLACSSNGCGTVFKIRARQETVVRPLSRAGRTESVQQEAYCGTRRAIFTALQWAVGGGTKCIGSHSTGCGTVYKVDASGRETVPYAFTGGADGAFPDDRLVMDGAANLYGTTFEGGEKLYSGTVYKLDPTGKETVLYSFLGAADGRFPDGLAIDAAGDLYGTTQQGGLKTCVNGNQKLAGCGTVFKLVPY